MSARPETPVANVAPLAQADREAVSKPELLDKLFARLLQDCALARELIEQGDVCGKAHAVNHALAIVTELATALDHAAAPQLCDQLVRLYNYVGACLLEGSQKMDTAAIARAEKALTTVKNAFADVARTATVAAA
jgi:flagellar biosynthetic protein FliS